MKKIFAVVLFALLLIGCDKSNPTDATSASSSSVEFSETSMLKTVDQTLIVTGRDSVCHDSLRNVHMLNVLNVHLGLSAEQFDSIKIYGTTLFSTLESIRQQVKDSLITRIQAHELVKTARDQFITSVQSVLTADQLTLLDRWIIKFWNNAGRRGEPRGHGRPGGPGGNGHPDRPHGPDGGRH